MLAVAAAPAGASSWPLAGGNASRSGTQGAPGSETPIAGLWSRGGTSDSGIRTPIVVTAGGPPGVQRAAYGTNKGTVHLQVLDSGTPVGAEEGVNVVDVDLNVSDTFGTGQVGVGFADSSTTSKLGVLYVVHNDGQGVEVARIDATTGTRIGGDLPVPYSAPGCTVNGSPVLSPPAADGSRILFFTLRGTCQADQTLVRIPIKGDATSPAAEFETPTFGRVAGLPVGVGPALVVLRDAFHVAVGRDDGVDFFRAGEGLVLTPGAAAPPAFTAPLPNEIAMTVSAPAAASGLVAGAEGSGAIAPGVMYVAANAGGQTRVHRLTDTGMGVAVASGAPIPNSGAPSPALAVAETVGPGGVSAGGRLVVTSATRLSLVRTSDLSEAAFLDGRGEGLGFSRATAATTGNLAFVTRDGSANVPSAQLALRLDTGALVDSFAPQPSGTGISVGQPAIARGIVVFGTQSGAFAYVTRDGLGPVVELQAPSPGSRVTSGTSVAARAEDDRGVASVQFRLVGPAGPRTIGRVTTPMGGSPHDGGGSYVTRADVSDVPGGEYQLEAVAVDPAGNATASARRTVVVSGTPVPRGPCGVRRRGTNRSDRLIGDATGERLLGLRGNDRLEGRGGADCLDGASGRDRLYGGTGRDRLNGGTGRDVLAGGAGNDRLIGGAGGDLITAGNGANRVSGGGGADRIAAVNGRRDVVRCGRGRDRVRADRADRVDRDCERVIRRR